MRHNKSLQYHFKLNLLVSLIGKIFRYLKIREKFCSILFITWYISYYIKSVKNVRDNDIHKIGVLNQIHNKIFLLLEEHLTICLWLAIVWIPMINIIYLGDPPTCGVSEPLKHFLYLKQRLMGLLYESWWAPFNHMAQYLVYLITIKGAYFAHSCPFLLNYVPYLA